MIRVLGNSLETVPLDDLNDKVYYKQLKEFTDQEYETSKDLKRAILKGKLALIEQNKSSRGSVETDGSQVGNNAALNVRDLKLALREVLPEIQNSSGISEDAVKGAVRDIAPLIVDMVRQEVSKLSISGTVATNQQKVIKKSKYIDPQYVPTVDTDGMVGNIEAKKRTSSSETVDDSLAALRALKKQQK